MGISRSKITSFSTFVDANTSLEETLAACQELKPSDNTKSFFKVCFKVLRLDRQIIVLEMLAAAATMMSPVSQPPALILACYALFSQRLGEYMT